MSKDLKSALDKLGEKEKEFSELDLKIPHTPHSHQEYRRVENKFINEINVLTVQRAHPLSQQNIFNTIIAKDFPDGQWQTAPDRVSQARYSDLYAYLNKINIVTLSLSEYLSEYGDISKKSFLRRTVMILQSYFFPGRPTIFILINQHDKHFSALIPIGQSSTLEPGDEAYFHKWHNNNPT